MVIGLTMACTKGKVKPDARTRLRLFSDSAGYCNRAECRKYLFSDENKTDHHIGEVAHILAASANGPRSVAKLDGEFLARYDNLILLCPNCHSIVDKCPELYPESLLLEWKQNHRTVISEAIGVHVVSSRKEAWNFLNSLLRKNESIHKHFGPDNNYRENPEAEEANIWKRKMISQIIPNNQKILRFIDKNIDLIFEDEREVVELFRQHVDDLVEKHLGNNEGIASRFPVCMQSLFR